MAERDDCASIDDYQQVPPTFNVDNDNDMDANESIDGSDRSDGSDGSDGANNTHVKPVDIRNHFSSGTSGTGSAKKQRLEDGLEIAPSSSERSTTTPTQAAQRSGATSGSKKGKRVAASQADNVSFTGYFTRSETDSCMYHCNTCSRQISVRGVGENARAQWANLKSHISNRHSEVYTNHVNARKGVLEKEERRAQQLKAETERANLIAQNSSISVSANKRVISDMIQTSNSAFEEKPVLNMPVLSVEQKTRLYMAMADWVARDNLSQNSFEKAGFSNFAKSLGFNMAPQAETIRLYQESLAESIREDAIKQLAGIISYSPLAMVSIQTDVWSSHDGVQQMGVRLTCLNPLNLEDFHLMLPLESALPGKLDAAAEAKLVTEALSKVNLSPESIYTQTTDTAAVALLSAVENSIMSVRCKSHQTALVVKDAVMIPDSRNYEFDTDDVHPLATDESDPVAARFGEVAARSAHFGRSATGARALADYQAKANKVGRCFLQWSPTRWTGVYTALLRDIQILVDGGIDFLKRYTTQPKSSLTAKAVSLITPSVGSVDDGLLILSMLRPLHELTLYLQSDGLSLGPAQMRILTIYTGMCSSKLTIVDSNGEVTSNKVAISRMDKAFRDFYETLRRSFFERLIDDIDDETVLNLALDPSACVRLKAFADVEITGSAKVSSCARDLLRRIQNDISNLAIRRITSVLSSRLAIDDPLLPSLPQATSSAKAQGNDAEEDGSAQDLSEMSIEEKLEWFTNNRRKDRAMPSSSHRDSETLERKAIAEWGRFQDARDDCTASSLEFWRSSSIMFPNVFHVFLQNQSARASNGRLESVFSIASGAVPVQRQSMSTETLNNIMIIKGSSIGVNQISKAARRHMQGISDSRKLSKSKPAIKPESMNTLAEASAKIGPELKLDVSSL